MITNNKQVAFLVLVFAVASLFVLSAPPIAKTALLILFLVPVGSFVFEALAVLGIRFCRELFEVPAYRCGLLMRGLMYVTLVPSIAIIFDKTNLGMYSLASPAVLHFSLATLALFAAGIALAVIIFVNHIFTWGLLRELIGESVVEKYYECWINSTKPLPISVV